MRPICKVCNKNLAHSKGKNKQGKEVFRRECVGCRNKRIYNKRTKPNVSLNRKKRLRLRSELCKRPYIKYKKSYCEQCKFVAIHSCQLDVDHIDGNHKNNEIHNLQTLCANCHRLKTYTNKDWK